MIDQSKFEEHLNYLRIIVDVLSTADDQQEAFDYLDRLHQGFVAEIIAQNIFMDNDWETTSGI